jgi:tight adherence protein B
VRRLRLAAFALVLVALALPAAGLAEVRLGGVDTSAYPTIRASIVSSKGARVPPILSENGIPVAGLQAQNLGWAKAVVLVVDRSQSMAGAPLGAASAAARSFAAAKQSADQLSVVAFGARPVALSPFSIFGTDADAALAGMSADKERGTALYDAIILSARQLKANSLPGRVIIALTDGADNASKHGLQAAINAARRANAAVYTVGIEGKGFSPDPLLQLSTASGGQYYAAASTSDLTTVYRSIAATLRRTWRIQYVTAGRPGDALKLKASVVGAGTDTSAFGIPRFYGQAGAPDPSELVPKGAYGPGGPLGLGVAVGFLVLLACTFFLTGMRGSWVRARIAGHLGETRGSSKEKRKERRLALLGGVFRLTEKALGNLKQWRWIGRMLERADVPLKTVEFFWIMMACAAGAGLFSFAFGLAAPFVLVLMLTGALIPLLVVWRKMRKRLRAFEDQLPDLLITIAASLKAGHSFKQGVQAVVDEAHPPASDMFKRVLTETALGRPMDDALAEMAERAGSKNFEFAITAVTIQRQVGGSLATLFDMVADTVRQRQQFARKIRSLTAMGRASAYVLIGLPFFVALAITVMNPTYMMPLYTTKVGHIMIGLGITMMAIGSVILKKIVDFKG